MQDNNHYFSTQSLSLATAIQAVSAAKLEFIEFQDSSKRANFVFNRKKDPSFDELVQRFWAKTLPVDASTYFEALRQLKARLYEEQNDRA